MISSSVPHRRGATMVAPSVLETRQRSQRAAFDLDDDDVRTRVERERRVGTTRSRRDSRRAANASSTGRRPATTRRPHAATAGRRGAAVHRVRRPVSGTRWPGRPSPRGTPRGLRPGRSSSGRRTTAPGGSRAIEGCGPCGRRSPGRSPDQPWRSRTRLGARRTRLGGQPGARRRLAGPEPRGDATPGSAAAVRGRSVLAILHPDAQGRVLAARRRDLGEIVDSRRRGRQRRWASSWSISRPRPIGWSRSPRTRSTRSVPGRADVAAISVGRPALEPAPDGRGPLPAARPASTVPSIRFPTTIPFFGTVRPRLTAGHRRPPSGVASAGRVSSTAMPRSASSSRSRSDSAQSRAARAAARASSRSTSSGSGLSLRHGQDGPGRARRPRHDRRRRRTGHANPYDKFSSRARSNTAASAGAEVVVEPRREPGTRLLEQRIEPRCRAWFSVSPTRPAASRSLDGRRGRRQ